MKHIPVKRLSIRWLLRNPIALINVIFIILIAIGFFRLMTQEIDVLAEWDVNIVEAREYRNVTINDEKQSVPVFNPGDILLLISKSTKLVNANGSTARVIICAATETRPEIEIHLDSFPANRAAGKIPVRQNAIIIPDVTQFDGLPRTCRLTLDIAYSDVILWRDHNERAETSYFIVEEKILNNDSVLEKIKEIESQINRLKN